MQDKPPAARDGLSDADRQLLRDSVRNFLSSRWPSTQAVELSGDAKAIAAIWRDLSAQGLTSLGADAAQGGDLTLTAAARRQGVVHLGTELAGGLDDMHDPACVITQSPFAEFRVGVAEPDVEERRRGQDGDKAHGQHPSEQAKKK